MSTNPVISSRFGRRPIMDVPPMSLSNQGNLAVPSIEGSYPDQYYSDPFPNARNPMLGPGVYNTMPATVPPPVNWPHPGYEYDRRYNTAPTYYPSYPGYNSQPNMYPGVVNPYGQYPSYPPPLPPQPAPRIVSDPSFGPLNPGFNITCDLEYGRIVNINVRESEGAFRGIPPFLRDELVRTYGKYPYTEVKVRLEGGEFHIYATHRKNRRRSSRVEDDEYSDSYYRSNDSDSDGIRPGDDRRRHRRFTHDDGWDTYR